MRYMKTSQLQPGMRLARPIYNKMGVMLYERGTALTRQGIASIENFGLWGIYILEPAEPLPPLSKEDIEFEQFQTVATFRLKDDLVLLANNMAPQNILPLAQQILRKFGSLDHKINYSRNLRSNGDYVYKHCLNTAILSAMMVNKLHYSYTEQLSIVCAALLHDMGLLLVPEEILEKGERLLSADERRLIRGYLEKGYHMLHPDYNDYKLPKLTLQIVGQTVRLEHNINIPLEKHVKWINGTHVLHVASMFDDMTSMNLDREPVSEIRAIRFLKEYPDYYPAAFVTALEKCLHILPEGACVDFTNGLKGIVVEENQKNYAHPVVVLFSNNQRVDFSDIRFQKTFRIADIMKTMDMRLPCDGETRKKYATDPRTTEMAGRYFAKRKKLAAAGRMG